jgi:hypothetical protein
MPAHYQTPSSVTVRRTLAQARATHARRPAWDGLAASELELAGVAGWPAVGRGIAQFFRSLVGTQEASSQRAAQLELPVGFAAHRLPLPTLSSQPVLASVRAYEPPDLPWQWG